MHLDSGGNAEVSPTQEPCQGPNSLSQPAWAGFSLGVPRDDDGLSLPCSPDSLIGVADRIDGPYNVDNVIGTIHMRIAEAISNLQENKDSITSKVGACAWACLRTRHVQLPGPNALLCSPFS